VLQGELIHLRALVDCSNLRTLHHVVEYDGGESQGVMLTMTGEAVQRA